MRIARMQVPIVTEIYASSGCESRIASETRTNRAAILLSRSGDRDTMKYENKVERIESRINLESRIVD